MEGKWSMDPKYFFGTLRKDRDQLDVNFTVGIDAEGELIFNIPRFSLDEKSTFIVNHFHEQNSYFAKFHLSGTATDGTAFECDNLIFTKLGRIFEDGLSSMAPAVSYSLAHFSLIGDPLDKPALTWRLKGFESLRALRGKCPLGLVEMVGVKEATWKNEISGFIRVKADHMPLDLERWKENATQLCAHIRYVMSFAASVNLASPLSEFYYNRVVKVEAYSQGIQERSESPVFSSVHLDEIFKCAVDSHFGQSFPVNNLNFAIQWFTMRGTYREAKLISSMTVLENLIDSNLSEKDMLSLSKKEFETLRKKLSAVVKEQAVVWTDDPIEQKAFIREFNNRFSDLKRRSLLNKIKLLATRWGVELEDIPESDIREAKSARDQVVHRGHYEPKSDVGKDLYDHVLTVRELVVRFVLTALQFEGSYMSYIGGYHARKFERNSAQLDCEKKQV